jgi:cold shock CspA family protein
MARSETYGKREKEKKRIQKRQDKEQRREDRKAEKPKSFEEMLAYIDENGNITSTPPDGTQKRAVNEFEIDLTSKNKGSVAPPGQRHGVVKRFDTSKGYGFIRDSQTSEEFFFHFKSANFEIAQSDRVTFKTEQSPRGSNAVSITKG